MTRREFLAALVAGGAAAAVPSLRKDPEHDIQADGPFTPLPVFHPAHPGAGRYTF